MHLNIAITVFTFFFATLTCGAQNYPLSPEAIIDQTKVVAEHRTEQHHKFGDPEKSPLKELVSSFEHLNYFPVDPAYMIPAKFTLVDEQKEFKMQTTTEREPLYRSYAILTFELNGKSFALHAYQNVAYAKKEGYDNSLFIPYKDHTNGEASYGGGRYIDLQIPEGNEVTLDFNLSYNPYCSYNPRYSCPIPPDENHLDVAILAGEKVYAKH